MASEHSAAARLRREAASVHHILCDLRRPPVGTPKCTCRVQDVALALAGLLDEIETHWTRIPAEVLVAVDALGAAILGSGQ